MANSRIFWCREKLSSCFFLRLGNFPVVVDINGIFRELKGRFSLFARSLSMQVTHYFLNVGMDAVIVLPLQPNAVSSMFPAWIQNSCFLTQAFLKPSSRCSWLPSTSSPVPIGCSACHVPPLQQLIIGLGSHSGLGCQSVCVLPHLRIPKNIAHTNSEQNLIYSNNAVLTNAGC